MSAQLSPWRTRWFFTPSARRHARNDGCGRRFTELEGKPDTLVHRVRTESRR
ncbi:hypothetical protein P376_3715 [Streptomyces sp. HCCB10043]|nr:hypothetical protein P376_3715 [Streptomyces sp. HCCB10043]